MGYEVSQIGVNIEESIGYVQSLGLNAKTITQDVVRNLDSMNRFNFNDGVQGLTKMAAQASMLRFEELEHFKKEKEEIMNAEKIRIIEKHLHLQKLAECKYSVLANFL